MQQRQLEFYRGFDLDQPVAKSKDSDEESDPEYSQDVQAHLEGIERCDETEEKSDEEDEPVSFSFGLHFASQPLAYLSAGVQHGTHAPEFEYRLFASGV